MIKLDITNKYTKKTTNFLVESIKIVDDVLEFRHDDLTHRFHLENYMFRINDNTIIKGDRKMNTNYEKYLIVDMKKNRGIQKKYKFENGRGASVVRYPYSCGGNVGLYELAVLDKYGYIYYTTPITNKVIGWLTWEEVIEILRKIKEL